MPALRIKLPNSGETTHVLRGRRITVGRAPDNAIRILHGSVSSHHAELLVEGGKYRLRDLQSTNRSYVEGRPVTDCDLNGACKILFGSVECEFDPEAAPVVPIEPKLVVPFVAAPREPVDTAFLENENRDLRAHLHAIQRRFDILSHARLVTSRTDLTPHAAAGDALKMLTGERDEFRQMTTGLRMQVERLTEELAVTIRERDAARQAAEALQAERAALHVELKEAQARMHKLRAAIPAPPSRPPSVAPIAPPPPPPGVIAKPVQVRAPVVELPVQVGLVRAAIAQLVESPADPARLATVGKETKALVEATEPLGRHALCGVSHGLRELVHDFQCSGQIPPANTLRTLRHTAEFLERLLDPRLFTAAKNLPQGHVLAIDDDADLLATVMATLKFAGLDVSGCASAEEAIVAVESLRFDAIIADVRLPEMNGPAFCAHTRALPTYRRTPIVFLTVADTLDKRAETSLSGGNEFIAKPFNVFELALKIETWVLKSQLQLL
jgi:CheY-like chemotaxis protein